MQTDRHTYIDLVKTKKTETDTCVATLAYIRGERHAETGKQSRQTQLKTWLSGIASALDKDVDSAVQLCNYVTPLSRGYVSWHSRNKKKPSLASHWLKGLILQIEVHIGFFFSSRWSEVFGSYSEKKFIIAISVLFTFYNARFWRNTRIPPDSWSS